MKLFSMQCMLNAYKLILQKLFSSNSAVNGGPILITGYHLVLYKCYGFKNSKYSSVDSDIFKLTKKIAIVSLKEIFSLNLFDTHLLETSPDSVIQTCCFKVT